ncbi:ABC transporter permease [Psychroserpens mesophilus]|uniref:ABC transporter permease n=1 Tax=Psychroserpens mesophilus TaxID=325473 RepID=UPI00058FB004|nr:ABC transporter permease [Psychroserpens mesophilus]
MSENHKEEWLYTISPKGKFIDLNFREIWRYRDLLFLFVKRDIITVYKQTVLGPLWFIIQPLFTSVIFTLVFNNLGSINTNGVPPFLFNLAGITAWNYFKECLTKTSSTFTANKAIFGKVYFPRVIMPLSITISNLLKLAIQFVILLFFYVYYIQGGMEVSLSSVWYLFPLYILMMALLGLGLGMIISSMTTKYRDLSIMIGFATQLLMYVSAVPYPVSEARAKFPPTVALFVEYNPLTQIIEGFRYIVLNTGTFTWFGFFYTLIISVLLFLFGLIIFNKTEKSFIDTI